MSSHSVNGKQNKTESREANHHFKKKNAVGIIKGYILCLGIDNREWSFIMGRISLSPLRHCGTERTFLFTLIWEIILFCFLQTFKHVIGTICCICHNNTVSWHDDNTVSWHDDNTVSWHDDNTVSWHDDNTVSWHDDNTVSWHDDNTVSWHIQHFAVMCKHWEESGPRLNIKTVLSTYGDFHVKDKTAVRTSYL